MPAWGKQRQVDLCAFEAGLVTYPVPGYPRLCGKTLSPRGGGEGGRERMRMTERERETLLKTHFQIMSKSGRHSGAQPSQEWFEY